MRNLFWLVIGGLIVASIIEEQRRASAQPLIPSIQPGGCLPTDPSISFGGKTYCLPQGIIPY